MTNTKGISLDELDSIMNLQRQEAFDEDLKHANNLKKVDDEVQTILADPAKKRPSSLRKIDDDTPKLPPRRNGSGTSGSSLGRKLVKSSASKSVSQLSTDGSSSSSNRRDAMAKGQSVRTKTTSKSKETKEKPKRSKSVEVDPRNSKQERSSSTRRCLREQEDEDSSSKKEKKKRSLGEKKSSKREDLKKEGSKRDVFKKEGSKRDLKEKTKTLGVKSTKSFEKIWGDEGDDAASPNAQSPSSPRTKELGTFLKRQNSESDLYGKEGKKDDQSVGARSQGNMAMPSLKKSKSADKAIDTPKSSSSSAMGDLKKKSKLDKIHELQGKYEKYKKDWIQVTKEKNKYKKDLNFNKLEVISLTKEIDTHMAETAILRQNLSEALQKVDKMTEEQQVEREEFSSNAKELAQARIDYTKSLNEARELRADQDQCETSLVERDRKITTLTAAVENQLEKVDDLEVKLDRAEDEIKKLEDELKTMEDELIAYRTAAAQEDDSDSGRGLKQVRDEMERRLVEERERRLEEKQKKLDDKMREFEEERERHLAKEKLRVREEVEQQQKEMEKQKEREEERQKKDDEINQRLKELEEDNSTLQARLKSEQLDSSVKLKKKDDAIANLQKDMALVKRELMERDSDPKGVNKLREELAAIMAEAESARMDLDEAQKQCGMQQEEIDLLHSVQAELRQEITKLMKEVADGKRSAEEWKKKADDLKTKSAEWTEKTFQWKEKAEHWEKMAKGMGPERAESDSDSKQGEAAPQALFLQAAMERRKSTTQATGKAWGRIGGLFTKGSEGLEESEAEQRIRELEEKNASQLETIKSLRSEIVKIQANFKEDAYMAQKRMQELQAESEAVQLKNTNLNKELELARKLERLARQASS